MNAVLQKFARQWLKDKLSLLSVEQQALFLAMYGYGNSDINKVVEVMDPAKLDWAMQQVLNTRAAFTDVPDAPPEAVYAIDAMAMLRAAMAAGKPDDRLEMLSVLAEGYCRYCGHPLGSDGRCHCENDE